MTHRQDKPPNGGPAGEDDRCRLGAAARAAAQRAHAPYSRFAVGAAVLDERGAIHAGCNVENASYGLTVCAERNAVAAAVAAGARAIRAVAIFTPTPAPTPPCGACRQVLAEFGDAATEVLMFSQGEAVERSTLGELLPAAFGFQPPAPASEAGDPSSGSIGS